MIALKDAGIVIIWRGEDADLRIVYMTSCKYLLTFRSETAVRMLLQIVMMCFANCMSFFTYIYTAMNGQRICQTCPVHLWGNMESPMPKKGLLKMLFLFPALLVINVHSSEQVTLGEPLTQESSFFTWMRSVGTMFSTLALQLTWKSHEADTVDVERISRIDYSCRNVPKK